MVFGEIEKSYDKTLQRLRANIWRSIFIEMQRKTLLRSRKRDNNTIDDVRQMPNIMPDDEKEYFCCLKKLSSTKKKLSAINLIICYCILNRKCKMNYVLTFVFKFLLFKNVF